MIFFKLRPEIFFMVFIITKIKLRKLNMKYIGLHLHGRSKANYYHGY